MTTLTTQRNATDCMVCCIAMALNIEYEQALEACVKAKAYDPTNGQGTSSIQEPLRLLGLNNDYRNGENVGNFSIRHKDWALSPDFYRVMVWGRPTIMSVPSLNKEGSYHAIYYDGYTVYDPSPKLTYTDFNKLQPIEVTLFSPNAPVEARVARLTVKLRNRLEMTEEESAWLAAHAVAW